MTEMAIQQLLLVYSGRAFDADLVSAGNRRASRSLPTGRRSRPPRPT